MGSRLIGVLIIVGLLQGNALADQEVKHDRWHRTFPVAWTDYHGYHGKKDQFLIWYRQGLLK